MLLQVVPNDIFDKEDEDLLAAYLRETHVDKIDVKDIDACVDEAFAGKPAFVIGRVRKAWKDYAEKAATRVTTGFSLPLAAFDVSPP